MPPSLAQDPADADALQAAEYANQFEIGFNAFEFLFDFGQSYEEHATERHWRIVTAPAYAKVFLALLGKSINDYEEAFGVIPDPPEPDP